MLVSMGSAMAASAAASNNAMGMAAANDQHVLLMGRMAGLKTQQLNYPPNSPQYQAIEQQLGQLQKTEKALLIQKELANANQMAYYAQRDAAQKAQADEFQRRRTAIQNGFIFG